MTTTTPPAKPRKTTTRKTFVDCPMCGPSVAGEDVIPKHHQNAAGQWRYWARCAVCLGAELEARWIAYNVTEGKAPTKCGGRCTHAKGGDCDCQCGGKNHGKGNQ